MMASHGCHNDVSMILELSDLEYDSDSKMIATETECADNRKLQKRRKRLKNCTLC